MKRLFMLFAAAALVLGAASCQKENLQKTLTDGQEQIDYSDDPMGVIKVYIKKDDTKMAFNEQGEGKDAKLYRSWEEKDVIDGCTQVDGVYKTFAYTVVEVGEEEDEESGEKKPYIVLRKTAGEAGVPSPKAGTEVNFVYAPGTVTFNKDGSCLLDLSKQKEGAIPAVMVASGEVEKEGEGVKLSMDFENIAAVMAVGKNCIALKDVNGTDFGEECSIKKIYAVTRILGTLTFDANKKYTLSDPKDSEFLSTTITPKGETFDDNDTVYLASLPYANKNISVGLRTDKGKFIWTSSTSSTVGENAYARVMTKRDFKLLPPNEAKFNNKEYTIEDAFEEAAKFNGSADIELIGDATTYETIEFTKNDGQLITLNLKGYNIDCKAGKAIYAHTSFTLTDDTENPGTISAGHTAVHNYKNEGVLSVLTIKNGKLIASGLASGGTGVVYSAGKYSKLEIEGGLIEATDNEGRAINVSNVPNDENPTTALVSGGMIISNGYAFRLYNADSKATIENAEIISKGEYTPLYSAASSAIISLNSGWVRAEGDAEIVNSANRAEISGGYFNKEVTPASGYKCTNELADDEKVHDGRTYTHKVVETQEAKIVETEEAYQTLALAVDAANAASSPVTIQMLSNANSVDTIRFTNANEITLMLDGKTVSAPIAVSGKLTVEDTGNGVISQAKRAIIVYKNGIFTLNSGKVVSTDNSAKGTIIAAAIKADVNETTRPKVYINGGTVEGGSTDGTIYGTNAECQINNGTIKANAVDGKTTRALYPYSYFYLTINGGTIEGPHCMYTGSQYAHIQINGGTFNPSVFAIMVGNKNKNISIDGGKFQGSFIGRKTPDETTKVSMSAGYFDTIDSLSACVNIAAGKEIKDYNKDIDGHTYKYTLGDKEVEDPVAEVYDADNKLILSLENETEISNYISQAEANSTVKMLKDVDLLHMWLINNTSSNVCTTLDLNGKNINAPQYEAESDTVAIYMQAGNIVITDNSPDGKGAIKQNVAGNVANATSTISHNGGTITIQGGNIENNSAGSENSNAAIAIRLRCAKSAATLNVTGGRIYGGRGIICQSGNSSRVAYVNICGGLVEGTAVTGNYSPVGVQGSRANITITGGTIKANKAKCIYIAYNYCSVEIKPSNGIYPFLWTNHADGKVIGSSSEYQESYSKFSCYTNKNVVDYKKNRASSTAISLSTTVKDEYGNEYSYLHHYE